MKERFLTLVTTLGVVVASQAQDGFPISTDRPSFSYSTGIIPIGRWQIESGYTFAKAGSAELQTFGEMLLRFPVSKRVELRFGNLGFAKANAAGGGGVGMLDPFIGFKYRFQTGVAGKTPDLSLVGQTTVPAGDRDFRVGRSQPSLTIAAYQQIDDQNGFGGSVTWSNLGKGVSEFHQWAAGAYWSRTLSSKAGTFLEIYQLMPSSKGGPHATFTDAGVSYLLDKATAVDFRIGTGLNQSRDGWFVGFGIGYRF